MLFINALVIQGLHHHHDADLLSHHSCEVKVGEELKYVDGAKLECKICEVIKQQSHFYDLPDAVVSIIFQENQQQSVTVFLPQHSSRYLLAAANKGPPEANA